jgi:hypothetical protein
VEKYLIALSTDSQDPYFSERLMDRLSQFTSTGSIIMLLLLFSYLDEINNF